MRAIGLDIGGTKIETQVFSEDWELKGRTRVPTPLEYPDFLETVRRQIFAAREDEMQVAIGIGAAGVVHPKTGRVVAANLAVDGQAVQEDLERILGLPISYLNDCDALTLSEAVFGAGANHRRVAAVILGTGVGGGLVQDGRVLPGAVGLGGEFGHTGAAAAPLAAFDLPVFDCGCGRRGCVETYLSGPGVQRLARHMTGADLSPEQIVLRRHGDMAQVWAAWCAIAGEFFHALTLIAAPDIIVLGGGLSQISGIVQDITQAAKAAQLTGFDEVPLVLAQGGETSGAKGAAFAALQAAQAADEGRAKGQDDDGR